MESNENENKNKNETQENVLLNNQKNIISLPPEEQTLKKPTNEENNNEKKKDIISNKENKETLFGNDKNIFSDNKPLFESMNLFGDNNNLFNNKNKTIFEENNNCKTLFGDDDFKEFYENNKSLFKDNDNRSKSSNNTNLFGENNNNKKNNDFLSLFSNINNRSNKNNIEENNDEENEEISENEKNEPSKTLIVNQFLKAIDLKSDSTFASSKIISLLHLDENFIFSDFYIDIKELKNGNFFILFKNNFFYINSRTFKILNIDKSLRKYCGFLADFSKIEEINKELIGIISKKSVLIVKINNKEAKLFQEIEIKAKMLKSFPKENLIIINEYIDEPKKKINILNYYIYDTNLKYQLQKKKEINFQKFKIENINIEDFDLFNCITNMKKFKNGKVFFFTLSDMLLEENRTFDSMYRSLYERKVKIILNIYLYENQELIQLYKKMYTKSFIYYEYLSESSEFAEFLNFWSDQNILMNEKDEIISFYIPDAIRYVEVYIKEKTSKRQKFKNYFKKLIIDKKKLYFFLHNPPSLQQFQEIVLFKYEFPHFDLVKHIFAPYCFEDILITKKGYLLGVANKIITNYSFSSFFNKYLPKVNVNTTLCLLNIPI